MRACVERHHTTTPPRSSNREGGGAGGWGEVRGGWCGAEGGAQLGPGQEQMELQVVE